MHDYVVLLKTSRGNNQVLSHIQNLKKTVGNDRFAVLENDPYVIHDANWCGWTWKKFTSEFPSLTKVHEGLPTHRKTTESISWFSPRFVVMAPIVLFYRGLLQGTCNNIAFQRGHTHVWSLESDASFSGNPNSMFFQPLSVYDADLMSTGYASATPATWWAYSLNTGDVPSVVSQLPSFDCLSKHAFSLKGVNVLSGKQQCPTMTEYASYIFRMVVVERYSPKAIEMVETAWRAGRGMFGEAELSTLCWTHKCKWLDWQELEESRHFSPFFIWNPNSFSSLQPQLTTDNKWIHPVSNMKSKSGNELSWTTAPRSSWGVSRHLLKKRQLLMHPVSVPRCSPFLNSDLVQPGYPQQDWLGPIQSDESLFLHALIRTSGATRILELGGLMGHSAKVFLDAMKCSTLFRMYTVDLVPVQRQSRNHKTIQKDAARLTLSDIDFEPLDLLFLDCHAFYATKSVVDLVMKNAFLKPTAYIVLHDTGRNYDKRLAYYSQDGIHQPVERLIAQYIQSKYGWQRISVHNDAKRDAWGRHGLTIMQKPQDLTVPCSGWKEARFWDVKTEDCHQIQTCNRDQANRPSQCSSL